jgi:hypothetical protein
MKKLAFFTALFLISQFNNAQIWTVLGGTVPGTAINANGNILAITSDATGNIYAAGNFNDSNGNSYVAKWDGVKWSELGGTVAGTALNANNWINTITTDAFGNVYAAGNFNTSIYYGHNYVAKWDGTKWFELKGTGVDSILYAKGSIYSITTDAKGNVYAAGEFTNGYLYEYVAKWDGTNWLQLGVLYANNSIVSITTDTKGNVYAAGDFTDANGYKYVAKWDGTKWYELGGTAPDTALRANGTIRSITIDFKGNIYAAGDFTDANGYRYVSKWDGTKWYELGGTVPGVSLNANFNIYSITSDALGNVYAAGSFTNSNGNPYVAKWDGVKWSELGGTVNDTNLVTSYYFFSITADVFGNVFASGSFSVPYGYHNVVKYGNFSAVTSIDLEKVVASNISIYPNPTNSSIILDSP